MSPQEMGGRKTPARQRRMTSISRDVRTPISESLRITLKEGAQFYLGEKKKPERPLDFESSGLKELSE